MTQAILYSFRRCPYAMRARMALSYANISYQHREILLKNKPQSMLDYSAKGTVPVLIEQTRVLDESIDIMKWALNQSDKEDWLINKKNNHQQNMWQLIDLCDAKFKPQLDKYKYSDRYELTEVQYRDESLWFLKKLNDQLSKHKYLIADQLSVADIAIFPFVRQYAFVNKTWFDQSPYSQLQKWLEKMLCSDLFIGIMNKHELWKDK